MASVEEDECLPAEPVSRPAALRQRLAGKIKVDETLLWVIRASAFAVRAYITLFLLIVLLLIFSLALNSELLLIYTLFRPDIADATPKTVLAMSIFCTSLLQSTYFAALMAAVIIITFQVWQPHGISWALKYFHVVREVYYRVFRGDFVVDFESAVDVLDAVGVAHPGREITSRNVVITPDNPYKAVVTYPFEARSEDEITAKRGVPVEALNNRTPAGVAWVLIRSGESEGLYPAAFIGLARPVKGCIQTLKTPMQEEDLELEEVDPPPRIDLGEVEQEHSRAKPAQSVSFAADGKGSGEEPQPYDVTGDIADDGIQHGVYGERPVVDDPNEAHADLLNDNPLGPDNDDVEDIFKDDILIKGGNRRTGSMHVAKVAVGVELPGAVADEPPEHLEDFELREILASNDPSASPIAHGARVDHLRKYTFYFVVVTAVVVPLLAGVGDLLASGDIVTGYGTFLLTAVCVHLIVVVMFVSAEWFVMFLEKIVAARHWRTQFFAVAFGVEQGTLFRFSTLFIFLLSVGMVFILATKVYYAMIFVIPALIIIILLLAITAVAPMVSAPIAVLLSFGFSLIALIFGFIVSWKLGLVVFGLLVATQMMVTRKNLTGAGLGNDVYKNVLLVFTIVLILSFSALLALGSSVQSGKVENNAERLGFTRLHESGRSSFNGTAVKYPICGVSWDGLSVVDFAFLANMAYLDATVSEDAVGIVETTLDTLFPLGEIHPDGTPYVNFDSYTFQLDGVYFYEFRSTSSKLSVVSVRGTTGLRDWLQDGDLWGEVVVFQILDSFVYPFLGLWPERARVTLVSMASFMEILISSENRAYYNPVIDYVKTEIPPDHKVYVTGHSLGGGVAKLVGAASRHTAVTFSAPGVTLIRNKVGITLEDVKLTAVTILSERDLVPKADRQGGWVNPIICDYNTVACHFLHNTMCELVRVCGDERGRWWNFNCEAEDLLSPERKKDV